MQSSKTERLKASASPSHTSEGETDQKEKTMNRFLLALSLCIGMVATNPYGEGISIYADDDG
jgi:hypothetical protein